MTHLKILLGLMAALSLSTSSPIGYNQRIRSVCPITQTCSCSSIFRDYELACPNSEPQVIVRVHPTNKLQIECTTSDGNFHLQLPEVNVGGMPLVHLHGCSLPQDQSIRTILNRFSVNRVRSLVISESRKEGLNTIKRHHFRALDHSVERLILRSNGQSDLPENLFEDFRHLKSLEMRADRLLLPTNIFRSLTQLEYLDLAMSNLTAIEAGMFRNQENLKYLNLWGNGLSYLPTDAFVHAPLLEDLDLGSNDLKTLPTKLFERLSNLTSVNLSQNKFAELPAGLFSKNKNLSRIRLTNNRVPLASIPEGLMADLPALIDVNMEQSNVLSLAGSLFSGSRNIRNISLAGNALTALPRRLLEDQINLLELDLSDNQLHELNDELFVHTSLLTVLRLSNNRLKGISENLLFGLSSLSELHLAGNNLHTIHRHAFSGCANLQVLDLHNNFLSFVDMDPYHMYHVNMETIDNKSPFPYLHELRVLNLRNNSMTTILMDWNYNNLQLRHLDLSFNRIAALSYSRLQFLSIEDLVVDLRHNAIRHIDLHEIQMATDESRSNGTTMTFLLNRNPLRCDCMLMHFVQFLRGQIAQNIATTMNFKTDEMLCAAPDHLAGKTVASLSPNELLCPLDSGRSTVKLCPEQCSCHVRLADKTIMINCANAGLTKVPRLPVPKAVRMMSIELNIENNQIDQLPLRTEQGYQHVTGIYAKNNSISSLSIDNLPVNLAKLDVSNNSLQYVNVSAFTVLAASKILKNLSLSQNPWLCNCDSKDLMLFVREHYKIISDFTKITCSNGQLFEHLMGSVCHENKTLYRSMISISIVIALMGVIVGVAAALYYKYQQEVKIWLFSRNLCMWLVSEEELDKGKKYDAFISYSHKDEEFVAKNLVPQLETGPQPFKICLHYRDWVAGEFIPDQIAKSVEDSRRTIVVLTPNFLESVWGKMEFRVAHKNAMTEGRARLIVVIYGDIEKMERLDPELKSYLRTNTYIKWGDPWFYKKLRHALPHPPGRQTPHKSTLEVSAGQVDLSNNNESTDKS